VIRPTAPGDTPHLLALTAGTGFFKPYDVEVLKQVLEDYHSGNHTLNHHAVTCERDGVILGYAYYAPVPMTSGTWSLWWIAVDKSTQARGVGGQLLRHAEDEVRRQGGRMMLIETSSIPSYEPTRRFYRKHGYEQEAVVHDYYADGDSLVIYRKRLDQPPPPPPQNQESGVRSQESGVNSA
jgi:ribosomal protein S18 acetylase RimI-like enzyme